MSTFPLPDRTDIAILRFLMNDARLSNKEVAAKVGLAPSSCHERLKTLRERNILLGSHAEVDLRALGVALEALLFVQLAKLKTEEVDKFVLETSSVVEVRSVFLVSGHFDLVVHVAISDMEHLKSVISNQFNRHVHVLRVETCMIFNRRTQHAMPLREASQHRSHRSTQLPKKRAVSGAS
ncbi:MAG: Lrp/AsnC family transcriptional regulator [Verrucomicrobia bacterium]|nr:Lrp/AsnC family transcriptional regulator [Verrucomicrobiota bacterium]